MSQTTQPNIPHPVPRTFQQKILDASCLYYQCTMENLKNKEFYEHRKIVMYLLRHEAMVKLQGIAVIFGYKDHSQTSRIIEEISSTKNIYAQIRHDLQNIMAIVNTLV